MKYLDGFTTVAFLGAKLFERRRSNKDNKGHQIRLFEYLERLRVKIENTKLAGKNHSSDGIDRRAVISPFVLSMLNKSPVDYIRFKLGP